MLYVVRWCDAEQGYKETAISKVLSRNKTNSVDTKIWTTDWWTNMNFFLKVYLWRLCRCTSVPRRVGSQPSLVPCFSALPPSCSPICVSFSITRSLGRTWKHFTPTIFLLSAQWRFLLLISTRGRAMRIKAWQTKFAKTFPDLVQQRHTFATLASACQRTRVLVLGVGLTSACRPRRERGFRYAHPRLSCWRGPFILPQCLRLISSSHYSSELPSSLGTPQATEPHCDSSLRSLVWKIYRNFQTIERTWIKASPTEF